MKHGQLILTILFIFGSVVNTNSQAESWNRLIPLVSSRSEAEELLGKPQKYLKTFGLYETKIGRFSIWFSDGQCSRARIGQQYKLKAGLVTGIKFNPTGKKALEEYGIKKDSLIRWPDAKGDRVLYFTSDGTTTYETFKDSDGTEFVFSIEVGPTEEQDKKFLCV